METSLVFSLVIEGLKLWNNERASQYLRKTIKLKEEYYAELSKPSYERSDLKLDELLDDLKIIAHAFVSSGKAGGASGAKDIGKLS